MFCKFKSLFAACAGVFIVAASFVVVPVTARAASENVMLILDASGSMWGRVDGQPKIEIAREVVGNVLKDLTGKVNLGVIAYGHRSKGECSDIETIIPVGKVDGRRYMSVINAISPKGKTPISDAVAKAADELKFREEKATIVLVSDGLETCHADPCALARKLEKLGIDFTIHVVGFDLRDKDTASLQCLAKLTGGKYISAENTGELADAIGTAIAKVRAPEPAPQPQAQAQAVAPTLLKVSVYLAKDKPALTRAYVYVIPADANKDKSRAAKVGTNTRAYRVPPGKYYLETKVGNAIGTANTEVKDGQTTHAKIILNAGLLKVQALPSKDGKLLEKAYVTVYQTKRQPNGKRKTVTAGNQRNNFTLPAGKYYVAARLGKAATGKVIEIKPGALTETTLILGAGVLKVTAVAKQGGEPLAKAYIYIYEVEKQTNGKRKLVTGGNQRNKFNVSAGTYYVTAQVGKALVGKRVEVIAGKRVDATIVLASGLLKVDVLAKAGGKPLKKAYITIYEAEKQVNGKRKSITGGSQRTQFSLPAGSYYVSAKMGKAIVARALKVEAGKLNQYSIIVGVGVLKVTVIPAEGAKPVSRAYVTIFASQKQLDGKRQRVTGANPRHDFNLAAGAYHIVAKAGSATMAQDVVVSAGKRTEVKVNLNAGALKVIAGKRAVFYVLAEEKNMDGTRDRIASSRAGRNPLILTAGKYLLVSKPGSDAAGIMIEIRPGKLTEVPLSP